MNTKALTALLLFATATALAQPKVFMFDDVQTRNEKKQWVEHLNGDEDCVAYFDEHDIVMNIDKLYHLRIVSTSGLPNDGIIYLCKDQTGNDVTITLIGNERLFFYDDEKRFLVNFVQTGTPAIVTASIVATED